MCVCCGAYTHMRSLPSARPLELTGLLMRGTGALLRQPPSANSSSYNNRAESENSLMSTRNEGRRADGVPAMHGCSNAKKRLPDACGVACSDTVIVDRPLPRCESRSTRVSRRP